MVYVDSIAYWPVRHLRYDKWCHMWADDINELHIMADEIGLKREWLHAGSLFPHYDLVPAKRRLAIKNGAVEMSVKEWYIKNRMKK